MHSRSLRSWLWALIGAAVLTISSGVLTARTEPTDAVAAGKNAFLENCAACHNASKRVGPPMVKDIGYFVRAGVPAPVMAGMLTHAVRQRPPESRMPAFAPADLSDADVANIAAYLSSQTPAPAAPPALGKAENGAWIYGVACAACHGEQGEGHGHAPALAGMANSFKEMKAPPNLMLGMVTLACQSGILKYMPTFPTTKLSDVQLADISAYIWSLPPPPAPKTAPAVGK